MRKSSKFEIRSSKRETSSGFEFQILLIAMIFLVLTAPSATNISAADDIPKLRPPRDEIPPTFLEKYELWVILGSIVFLALICAIVWIATRPRPPIIILPEVRAKQALDLLLTKPENGLVLSQVSQILRHYVTEAFSLPAGELTTSEFCNIIAKHEGLGPELANGITEFLRRCDERKFVPSPPTAPMAAVANAIKFVESSQIRLAELRRRAEQAAAT